MITLGIIGVVAAMTIPTLMQSTQQKETITSLKKAYSVLSQAYTMAVQENGSPDSWGLVADDGAGAEAMMKMLKPYLNVTKDCGTAGDCFPSDGTYKHLVLASPITVNGYSNLSKVQLADGSLLAGYVTSANCTNVVGTSDSLKNVCGFLEVDINGFKKPNTVGKDFFLFYLTKDQIIPAGTKDETSFGFSSDCIIANADGWGCTAWVIYNENLDYLKCPSSLSWSGQAKCN